MKVNQKLTLLTLLLLATVHQCSRQSKQGQQLTYDGNVLHVTDGNFQSVVDKFNVVFLKFYAPWCPHCQDLAPKWNTMAKKFFSGNTEVVFGHVNGENNSKTSDLFNVRIYEPTQF